jgi:RimJ/RimL family protein N-acetyltransferase
MTQAAEPIHVHFETDRFVLRTLSPEDASPRWAGWLNDPVSARMLNVPPRAVTVEQLRELIRAVDQYEKLLLGIFVLGSNRHIGVVRFRFIDQRKRVIPGVLIGETEWRNAGVLHEVANAVGTYFFETFGLEAIVARVPAHNTFMKKYLEDREWQLVGRMAGPQRSPGEPPSELLVYELPRAVWLDRKRRGFFGGPDSHADA